MTAILILANICQKYCCRSDDHVVCHKICCTTLRKLNKGAFLSAFEYKDAKDQPTGAQAFFFYFNYFSSLAIWSFYTFASIYYATLVEIKSQCTINVLNLTWYIVHAYFHFIAIHICFIFSKVIYIATNKLEQISESLDKVNQEPSKFEISNELKYEMSEENQNDLEALKALVKSGDNDKRDKGQYYLLQIIYQSFVEKVKPTLNLLGYWFIAHWLLHALTTVLLSAVIIEMIMDFFRYKVTKENDEMLNGEDGVLLIIFHLVYIFFFALEHTYLFVYPCFRAASIAAARVKLINKIFKKRWDHISLNVNTRFIQYLTSHDFAFKVSIFCFKHSFGLSMACVSLIFALYGGLVTLKD